MYSRILSVGLTSCLLLVLLIAPVMAAGEADMGAGSSGSGQSVIGSDPTTGSGTGSADPNSSMGGGQSDQAGQQAVSGTLEKISDGTLSLKTTDGQTKDYTIKNDKKSQIQSIGLKKGDRVVAQLDAQNEVVDVTRMGTGG
jgi:hypothetical protein